MPCINRLGQRFTGWGGIEVTALAGSHALHTAQAKSVFRNDGPGSPAGDVYRTFIDNSRSLLSP
jgi:hypothetical protein